MKRIIAVVIAAALLLCSCAKDNKNPDNISPDTPSTHRTESDDYINAVWLSFFEISALCKDTTEKEFREKIINLAANLLSLKINRIIVHAVAFCDAFYESDFLPKSRYIKASEDFDVFGIICEICSKAGIETDAWINPYRVSSVNDLSVTDDNKAVKKLYSQDKNSILICENGIYLNPASTNVQNLILSQARELMTKYPVNAIHIDDYFYPEMSNIPDKGSYDSYVKSNGNLSINDWRRENINTLVSSLHLLTNSFGKKLAVSPAADIKKNYELKYADISLWLDNGWVDEIIPQIYFGFENENAPFEKVLKNWINETKGKSAKLIIGLAFYKCGKPDLNAGSGKNEWKENSDIIERQISLIKKKSTIYGVAFFSYSHIFGKNIEKNAKKELQNIKSML